MKWNPKREILPLAVFIILAGLSLYFYPRLPESVPSHFDYRGAADGFSSKGNVVLFNIVVAVGLYLLLTFLPFIDPFWRRIQSKYSLFLVFRDFMLLFLLFMYVLIILGAKEGKLPTGALGTGFGLLFVFIGNYLPKLPRNFFFGIRSPWTLASEVVWKRTHQLSGWLWVVAGLIVTILSLAQLNAGIVMLVVLTPVVVFTAIVYPFWLYRKLQKENKLEAPEL